MEEVKKSEKKSIAKANGLKSTFFIDGGKSLMTSFGNGNSAVLEKMIDNFDVEELHGEHRTFDAAVKSLAEAHVKGRCGESDVALPKSSDTNLLRAKSTIEQIYFGKTFTDNIHIQIAYNIMDIKKIFAIYANTVVVTVNNLRNRNCSLNEPNDNDFLGMFFTFNDAKTALLASLIVKQGLIDEQLSSFNSIKVNSHVWTSKKDKQLKPLKYDFNYHGNPNNEIHELERHLLSKYKTLGNLKKAAKSHDDVKRILKSSVYFGDAFLDSNGNVDDNTSYTVLCLLGILRQQSFHELSNTSKWLFNIESQRDDRFEKALNKIFNNKLDKLNKDFLKNSKVNLSILFDIYRGENKSELVKEYYDFSVRKAFKNMGFSIKTLRETILTFNSAKTIADQRYDTVRSKFYSLFDFIIYRYYITNQKRADKKSRAEAFVDKLRMCVEIEDKPKLYENEAKTLWANINNIVLEQIMPKMNARYIRDAAKSRFDDSQYKNALDGIMQTADKISLFAKMMYCVSLFLDGKEINCLLTSLINKFDNINSLCEVLVNAGYESDNSIFINDYKLFADSKRITDELRFVNSFARMSKTAKAVKDSDVSVNLQMYYDSAAVFGESDKEKVREKYCLKDKNEEDKKVTKYDKALRNFMINNVINSNRFNYVTRFIN
ncbi:MAG: type VI-D CRISPR-associated RNA-guided ribonuclease Cas13d, partial [Acutalibacteraceae bacterium]